MTGAPPKTYPLVMKRPACVCVCVSDRNIYVGYIVNGFVCEVSGVKSVKCKILF